MIARLPELKRSGAVVPSKQRLKPSGVAVVPPKQRVQSKLWSALWSLPDDERRRELVDCVLAENLTYAEIVPLLREKFGIETNRSNLSAFRQTLYRRGLAKARAFAIAVAEFRVTVMSDGGLRISALPKEAE